VEPTFLTLGEVVEIHKDQVERYGGHLRVRDLGLLQSAIAMPAASFGGEYLHSDLCEMAAYLYHIIGNHPFIDGNKRVGAVAAAVFLSLNDAQLEVDEDNYEHLVMSVASGTASKSTVAEFLRENTKFH